KVTYCLWRSLNFHQQLGKQKLMKFLNKIDVRARLFLIVTKDTGKNKLCARCEADLGEIED
ncbi:MAG: hypothetical protein QNJ54_35885, partial [Prochloraceae cyanobacterium]|nr:hypothetical protein [Prochloraceae cyanobacterium]